MTSDAPFPAETAKLFNVLVNQLIDGIEQISRNSEAVGEPGPVESRTSTTSFNHSTLYQSKPCTRSPQLRSFTARKEINFQNNKFQCSSEPHKAQSTVVFDNYESGSSSLELNRKIHSFTNQKTDGYENVRCCNAPYSSNRKAAGRDQNYKYTASQNVNVQEDTESKVRTKRESNYDCKHSVSASTLASSQRATVRTKRLAGDREGYEVTVNTIDHDGNPLEIRTVCPEFVPRRVWLNGQPLDYIDEESEDPIMSQPCFCGAERSDNGDTDVTTYEDSETSKINDLHLLEMFKKMTELCEQEFKQYPVSSTSLVVVLENNKCNPPNVDVYCFVDGDKPAKKEKALADKTFNHDVFTVFADILVLNQRIKYKRYA